VLQSHSLLSRLPQNLLQSGAQNPAQSTVTASLGQRSRLPPPGFPGSTPNHMNSFGLGIPRPAPTNSTLSGWYFPPFFHAFKIITHKKLYIYIYNYIYIIIYDIHQVYYIIIVNKKYIIVSSMIFFKSNFTKSQELCMFQRIAEVILTFLD